MSNQRSVTGMITLTVIEASGLKPVTLPGGKVLSVLDPYVVVDFDGIYFGKTSAKPKTSFPVWGEVLEETVEDPNMLQCTIFHKSTIPPDPFLAHLQITIAELRSTGQEDFEVSTSIFKRFFLLA